MMVKQMIGMSSPPAGVAAGYKNAKFTDGPCTPSTLLQHCGNAVGCLVVFVLLVFSP